MNTINIEVARKVLSAVDAGLVKGVGKPVLGQMCVEAAVCYALGLPHGDDPKCVSPVLRRLKIRLNDSAWSSNEARAKGLRRLALIQLGSARHLDDTEFVKRVARLTIQSCVPQAFRAAARLFKGDKKNKLLNAADACEKDPTTENARAARRTAVAVSVNAADAAVAFSVNAADAAVYAVAVSVNAAADAVAFSVNAADAAVYAAAFSAYAADAVAVSVNAAADAAAYAAAAVPDKALAAFAEGVVQILIDMKAPGAQWLTLTEAA